VGRHIAGHDGARSYNGITSDPDARQDSGAGAHRGTRANQHSARENGAGGDVRTVPHYTIVLDYRAGIDNDAFAHSGRGIDHCEWEHHRPAPED
jgi:hypothetical protein